jgi:protein-S-isoprenylcysteine O-methyltransferase Ste14
MTAGHALLAAGLTGYMLVAVIFEERDLVAHFGRAYEGYRRRVPMFLPLPHFGSRATRPAQQESSLHSEREA